MVSITDGKTTIKSGNMVDPAIYTNNDIVW